MLQKLKRYFLYLYQYFLCEKRKGLDFTMRDTGLYESSKKMYHGYSKTDEKHVKEIFNCLSFERTNRLLDVGCGKGVVLRAAADYPFRKIAGIELQAELVEIARRNFRILGLENKIECFEANALAFDGYGNYDIFFFFNPFSEAVLEKVIKRIVESRKERGSFLVIYHNPQYIEVFDKYEKFQRERKLHDTRKGYDTFILEYDNCPEPE